MHHTVTGQPPFTADATPLALAGLLVLIALVSGAIVLFLTYGGERRRTRTLQRRLAVTDVLTGLANRARWETELRRTLAEAARAGRTVTVALLDIDHFGSFNERYGRDGGDALLEQTAHAWLPLLPAGSLAARFAADDFGVLLTGVDEATAEQLVGVLRSRVPQAQRLSAGVAQWDGAEPAAQLEDRAAAALVQAQQRLGNRTLRASTLGAGATEGLDAALAPPSASAATTVSSGAGACSQPGCPRTDAARCAYVDRRHRRCPTHWCPDHAQQLHGRPFCRRHGGIVAAMGPHYGTEPLPDLDNRAPSLCNWVARDLDDGVRTLLSAHSRGVYGVKSGAVRPSMTRDRHRVWRSEWDLYAHTGTLLSVYVGVDEAEDSVVRFHVDSEHVLSETPPWISGPRLDDDADVSRRLTFYESVIERLRPVVERHAAALS